MHFSKLLQARGIFYQICKWWFPKTVFGKKRSFNTNWYSKFPWLHCDIKSDSIYCYTYMNSHTTGYKAVSRNSNPVFRRRGYRSWKKCSERFLAHQNFVIRKGYQCLHGLVKQILIQMSSFGNSFH